MERLKTFWKNLSGVQRVSILFGVIVFVIAVVMIVYFAFNSGPNVEISFSDGNNISSTELKKVRETLSNVIRNNTDTFDSGVTYYGVARNYNETKEDDEYTTASFIVDFDDIKESYTVIVTWPDPNDGSPNIIVSCALLDGKYPETPCATETNSSSNVVGYLPYEGLLPSGGKYSIDSWYDDGEIYLEIQTDSCGNVGILNEALTAAKEWLSSIHLNPDDYLLYVPGDICSTNPIMDTYPYIQANHAKTNDANVNKYLPYFVPDAYNVYPIVDESNNVISISARVPGCYEYQQEPGIEFMKEYLQTNGINYPVEFLKCED